MALWVTGDYMAVGNTSDQISAILIKNNYITPVVLKDLQNEAATRGIRLEKLLAEKKLIKPVLWKLTLAEYLDIPPITLSQFTPGPALLELLPKDVMSRKMVIPVGRAGKLLTLAVADPFDMMAIDEISMLTGLQITPLIASESEITEMIGRVFKESTQGLDMEQVMKEESEVEVLEADSQEQSLDEMLESAEGAPVIRMVNMILVEALRTGASDIHIEPMEKKVRLRYRIDGVLSDRPGPPKGMQSAVISRIKIMSELNIAERRVPQDGHIKMKLGEKATAKLARLQRTGEAALQISSLVAEIGREAELDHAAVTAGAAMSRAQSFITVAGERARIGHDTLRLIDEQHHREDGAPHGPHGATLRR
jgi:type IV pilus assembly protein PilB